MGKINRANVKKAIYYLKRNGIVNTWYAVRERMDETKDAPYRYVPPTIQMLEKQREASKDYQTLISIVVPTYHTVSEYLRELIDSVLQQTYPQWELILADASTDDSVEDVVRAYSDDRIRYIRLGENAGIAENTNRALQYVTGEYVGLLDHDDVLTEDALYQIVHIIEKERNAGNEVKILYSDEDKCNSDRTEYYEPNFKQKFNLDLLLSNNYICHFLVMEGTLIKELGFRSEFDGAQDYDLVLRAVECLLNHEEQMIHVPRVLYHWRCHTGSTAENPQSKMYAYEAGRRALQDFACRQNWKATAEHLKHLGFYKLTYLSQEQKNTASSIQNIFENRKDIGVVGGRVLSKGKVVGGRMNEDGSVYYEGLPAAYSGYLHRAILPQNADAVDIRAIQIRKECIPIFEKTTGVLYKENPTTKLFDATALPKDTDYRKVSVELGRAIREAGYRILYQPSLTVK